jgi:hypothetical protein
MYREIIKPEVKYGPICKGLKIFIIRICECLANDRELIVIKEIVRWVSEVDVYGDFILDFGNVLEYDAMIYTTDLYEAIILTYSLSSSLRWQQIED